MQESDLRRSALKIRVLDDDANLRDGWVNQIKTASGESDVEGLNWDSDDQEVVVLESRRRSFLDSQADATKVYSDTDRSVFDDVDLLFVDYKLFADTSDPKKRRLTGLELAYLIRAYSKCKVIVALNSQGGFMRAQRHFDLTLRDASERIENLHITSGDLVNPGLWRLPDAAREDYRPWVWPLFSDEVSKHDARLAQARTLLDDASESKFLVDLLGFDQEERYSVPAFAIDHLGREGLEATANDFLWYSGNVVRGDDFEIEHDRRKAEDRSKNLSKARTSLPCIRLFAAAIHRWLERMVIPNLDVLIDRPHLLMRWPGLLSEAAEDAGRLTDWARSGMGSAVPADELEAYRFNNDCWLSRPAYWWSRLQRDEKLASRVKAASRAIRSKLVFQEDTSRFASSDSSVRFRCNFPSTTATRFLAGPDKFKDINYEPASRLA